MLGSELADAVRKRLADRPIQTVGGPRRNRLFAFGFDAYRVAAALQGGCAPIFRSKD